MNRDPSPSRTSVGVIPLVSVSSLSPFDETCWELPSGSEERR